MDIEGIEVFSKVMVLISSSLALIGILLKGSNEFFFNTIRRRYETIPGQKSVFSMVIAMILGIIAVVDIVFWVIVVAVGIIEYFKSNSGYKDINDIRKSMESIVGVLFIVTLLYGHVVNIGAFFKVWNCYVDIFEGKVEWYAEKKWKSKLSRSSITHVIIIVLSTLIILYSIFSKNKITYNDLCLYIAMDISSIVGFGISYSLIQVIKNINAKNKYTLVMANKKVSCRLYLDIGEYYLLFLKGKETRIRKTEVKEIICDNIKSVIKRDKKKVDEEMVQKEESLST